MYNRLKYSLFDGNFSVDVKRLVVFKIFGCWRNRLQYSNSNPSRGLWVANPDHVTRRPKETRAGILQVFAILIWLKKLNPCHEILLIAFGCWRKWSKKGNEACSCSPLLGSGFPSLRVSFCTILDNNHTFCQHRIALTIFDIIQRIFCHLLSYSVLFSNTSSYFVSLFCCQHCDRTQLPDLREEKENYGI